MSDYEVSTDVDEFMKSAESDEMRDRLSITYDTVKTENTVMTNVYVPIGSLTTPVRGAGKYKVEMSVSYTYDTTTRSAMFRFRVDAGPWYEFSREPKDSSDATALFYAFPADYAAGIHTVELESRKEITADNMVVDFCDVSFQRVG